VPHSHHRHSASRLDCGLHRRLEADACFNKAPGCATSKAKFSISEVRAITEMAIRRVYVRILIKEDVVDTHLAVSGLRDHLRCLESQNCRNQQGSSFSLYFEDANVCCKSPFLSCRSSRCALIHFVPEESRSEPAPCRHIRLGERGETLHSLYAKGEIEQTHAAVRNWLVSTIAMLDSENCVANKKAA